MRASLRIRLASFTWIAREAIQGFSMNRDMAVAAMLTFYGFLALMPLLLLLIYILGVVAGSSEVALTTVHDFARRLFPVFSPAWLEDLANLAQSRLWGAFGAITLAWSLMPFAAATRWALRRIFRASTAPPLWLGKLLDAAMVTILLLLFLAMAGSKILLAALPLTRWSSPVWEPVRALLTAAIGVTAIATVYRIYAPRRVRATDILVGAVTTTLLLAAARPAFGWILRLKPDYGFAFGSLKTLFLTLVWAYYTLGVMLFGAEVAAARARRESSLLQRLFRAGDRKVPASLLRSFVRTCSPGEVLFREGDRGVEMYYILRGAVRLTRGDVELKTMRAGEYFGEMSMLLEAPRTATATVVDPDTELVVISQKNFDVIVAEDPQVVLQLLREMARRLADTDRRLTGA